MELLQQRFGNRNATASVLYVDGELETFILEDPVRERGGVPVADWKIPGRTAISAGRFRLTLEDSPRFGPDTITLNNVPGFAGVRMHGGNKVEDTEGCPLTGDQLQSDSGRLTLSAGDVGPQMEAFVAAAASIEIVPGTSQSALKRLKSKIRQAIRDRGEEVWLEIRNPEIRA